MEDVIIEATPPPPPPPVQSGTDYSKVFTAFDEGKTLIDVVKQDLCDPDKALELWEKYAELKNMDLEIKGRPLLEERVDNLKNQLFDLRKDLQNLLDISYQGTWVKEKCKNYSDGYCHAIHWDDKPEGSFIQRTKIEKGKWIIDPVVRYCALCPQNTLSTSELISEINKHEKGISDIMKHVTVLLQWYSHLRNSICPNCRQPGVILLARCRVCGMNLEHDI